jgi:anhydro-N-acetylmuramic acid kinase
MIQPLLTDYPFQRSRVVIGLISGTSADGIDAAAVRFPPWGEIAQTRLEVLNFLTLPYPTEIREKVLLAAADRLTLRQTAVLGTELGHLFAEAALAVMPESGCDLVASHGQTVCHLPESQTTLQLGDAAVIASKTGVRTIADFRTADMACGGQGAPLVPLFDAYLLSSSEQLAVAVNLGGIANITVLPPAGGTLEAGISAWDTGPANCVSDALCRLSGNGEFDPGGGIAASGRVLQSLLQELLQHPYFGRGGPKSTGLEDFGEDYARGLLGRGQLPDLLRTALALSAQSLVNDLLEVARQYRVSSLDLIFAGGGTSNAVLMGEIRERLQAASLPARIRFFSEFGVPEAGREAVAFAFLGDRTALGLPGAARGATGARRPAVLGKVSFPPAGIS